MNNGTNRPKCKRCLIFTLLSVKQLRLSQGKQINLFCLQSPSCGVDCNTEVVNFLYGKFGVPLIQNFTVPNAQNVSVWSAVSVVGISVSVSYQDVFESWQIFHRFFIINTLAATLSLTVTSLEMGRSCMINKWKFIRNSLLPILRCYLNIRHMILWNIKANRNPTHKRTWCTALLRC